GSMVTYFLKAHAPAARRPAGCSPNVRPGPASQRGCTHMKGRSGLRGHMSMRRLFHQAVVVLTLAVAMVPSGYGQEPLPPMPYPQGDLSCGGMLGVALVLVVGGVVLAVLPSVLDAVVGLRWYSMPILDRLDLFQAAIGSCGALLAELMHWHRIARRGRWPKYGRSWRYWLI